ncbi:hypothetical protein GCM10023081_47070 [Arthrobacter ginkgonis]|uniref:Phage FDXHR zinc binding domain-containing protein n=1 Tax=Arthrobacter ginkgonis TaxID=1630594 RepID=A0ABP7DKX5_9MICC
MASVTHPKCGKTFPGGERTGHCGACCETFIGLISFEAHRVGEHGTPDRRCELKPYISHRKEYPHTTLFGHWPDERGFWHFGEKLTDEQKATVFGGRK